MKLNIEPFDPCEEGLEYYNRFSTFEEAWNACDRGDRMLWIAVKLKVDDRVLTRAAALCANTVRHLMKDERSTDAVDAALRYADDEISGEELNKYARYAYDAYYASAADWAAWAAYCAACSDRSVDAVRTACSGRSVDAVRAAYAASRLETANICREVLTGAVFEKVRQINDN